MSTIRVAIAGVGNCASSLIQGVEYYRDADPTETVPGLMHVVLGGYHVGDLEFVAAFDADAAKVGTDLGKAIFAGQNNTIRFAGVGELGVTVQRGPTLDGFGKYYRETVEESPAEPVDVVAALKDARADVLVSYLPVGSEQAQRFYAEACLQAGVGFVNAIPVFIASDPEWARRFHDAGLPIVGDDIKSQVGSTIVHRILTRLFEDRGLALDHTYQLNVGGNMDFKNMLGARPARVEEGLEDPGGDQPDRARRPRRPTTSTSARRTMCRGSTTASGPTSAWRAATSATCRSTSSSSSRCGTRPTRPASSSTPSGAPSSPSTGASAARCSARRPIS